MYVIFSHIQAPSVFRRTKRSWFKIKIHFYCVVTSLTRITDIFLFLFFQKKLPRNIFAIQFLALSAC